MAGNDCGALLDEELSSFFLNYLADTQVRPAGAAGRGPGVLSCGGCRRSRGGREATVGPSGGSGVPGCGAPLSLHPERISVSEVGSWGLPPRKPERGGSYGRWGGSGLGCLESAPPPRRQKWGLPRFLGEVEPRQGVGDPQAGPGCWRRALRLPALAAVLSRGLVAPAQTPAPVPRVPWSSGLGCPECCCWPPAAPHRRLQRRVSCRLPAKGLGGLRGTWTCGRR